MKKILIIEDEMAYVNVLRDRLEADYVVLYALDGYTGLHMALAEKPEIIIVDIRMPQLDGHGVLKKLRQDAYGRTVKVVVLTNIEPDRKSAQRMVQDSLAYYFVKSDIPLSDLVRAIQQLEPPE